jgi:hypothetical protein
MVLPVAPPSTPHQSRASTNNRGGSGNFDQKTEELPALLVAIQLFYWGDGGAVSAVKSQQQGHSLLRYP